MQLLVKFFVRKPSPKSAKIQGKICQKEKIGKGDRSGKLDPWSLWIPSRQVLPKKPILDCFCSFEPFGLYHFLKIYFSGHEIHRSLTTSWIHNQNHGFIIGHFEIINWPTKKAYFLPNWSTNRQDWWYWPTWNNQYKKFIDNQGRITKGTAWPPSLQMLWRPLNAVNCPLLWMTQSKS